MTQMFKPKAGSEVDAAAKPGPKAAAGGTDENIVSNALSNSAPGVDSTSGISAGKAASQNSNLVGSAAAESSGSGGNSIYAAEYSNGFYKYGDLQVAWEQAQISMFEGTGPVITRADITSVLVEGNPFRSLALKDYSAFINWLNPSMQAAGFIGAAGSMILNNSVFGSSTRTGRMYGNNANVSGRAAINAKPAEKLRMKLRDSTTSKRYQTYDTDITIEQFRKNLRSNKYTMKPSSDGLVEQYFYKGKKEFIIRSEPAKSVGVRSADMYINDNLVVKIRFYGEKY